MVDVADVAKWVDSTVRRRTAKESLDTDERRAAVIEAAVAAIDEHGPGVGMAQIAERAGIPRPNVYRHFASKDQLDDEVARYASRELIGRIRPALARGGTPLQVIRGAVAPSFAYAAEHPHLYRFLAAQRQTRALHRARTGRPQMLSEVVATISAYVDTVPDMRVPPEGVLAGLMGMIDASVLWWLDHKDETEDEAVDRVARQIQLVLADLLAQLGLSIPDDLVLDPLPGSGSAPDTSS
jgi:AcrR family transcriptional regulator